MAEFDAAKFDERVEQFMAALQLKIGNAYANHHPTSTIPIMGIMIGARYIRIVRRNSADEKSGSAYGFIERTTGNILKPAGWKAPAKHARGNIFQDDLGLHCCTMYSIEYLRK